MWLLLLLILIAIFLYIKINFTRKEDFCFFYPNCMETVSGNIRCYAYDKYYYPLFPWTYFHPYY